MTQEVAECPCGSGLTYQRCCEPCHTGSTAADTAEKLMRSRYTAYAFQDWRYLFNTWDPQTRPSRKSLSRSEKVDWAGLDIIVTTAGQPSDESGTVEFRAYFKSTEGSEHPLHEKSRFARLHGKWVYVEGEILSG